MIHNLFTSFARPITRDLSAGYGIDPLRGGPLRPAGCGKRAADIAKVSDAGFGGTAKRRIGLPPLSGPRLKREFDAVKVEGAAV